MIKKLSLFIVVFLSLFFQVFSATTSINCEFKSAVCDLDEELLFYAHKDFYQTSPLDISNVLNSKVDLFTYNASSYSRSLCCKVSKSDSSPVTNVDINTVPVASSCSLGYKDLIYFTNDTNARLSYPSSTSFNISHYTHKVCVGIPNGFSSLDILVSEYDKTPSGYSCLYRSNQLESGVISSCDSVYGGGNQYQYIVWARLFETTSSLKCDDSCTSRLDGRVYTECSTLISSCQGIPIQCNGVLLDSWVEYSSTSEIQCSKPWTNTREKAFTSEVIEINYENSNSCINLLSKEYPVIVNNELVTMKIYVCSD